MSSSKILVTGSENGFGRYLFEKIGSIGLDKNTSPKQLALLAQEGADVIIHCAFNSSPEVAPGQLASYLQDTIFLTSQVAHIPHKKFIFISSVDVYPKNSGLHRENEVLSVDEITGIYGKMKFFSEVIVRAQCPNALIIRSTAFLGAYSTRGSFKKMKEDANPKLTLTADSQMNYVLYENVLEFIQIAIEKDLQGIYNIASAENITLDHVAAMFHEDITFGQYHYDVGLIDNAKAAALIPAFKKTSKETIQNYL